MVLRSVRTVKSEKNERDTSAVCSRSLPSTYVSEYRKTRGSKSADSGDCSQRNVQLQDANLILRCAAAPCSGASRRRARWIFTRWVVYVQ